MASLSLWVLLSLFFDEGAGRPWLDVMFQYTHKGPELFGPWDLSREFMQNPAKLEIW